MDNLQVACFGEVLWDVLDTGRLLGGAPLNVAHHLNSFGIEARMISRVGKDELGEEILSRLAAAGMNTQFVGMDEELSTGTVKVTMAAGGFPSYEIVRPVAWDAIETTPESMDYAATADAIVFGSLACRDDRSKDALLQLLDDAPLKVFDLNLRPPFYDRKVIEYLLQRADLVKTNDEELEILLKWHGQTLNEEDALAYVAGIYDLQLIILTKGKDGAVCYHEGSSYHQGGFPVEVTDTIGSGDSFLAGFLYQYLTKKPPEECLRFAAATGALVATKAGGTPPITVKDVLQIITKKES